MKVVFLNVDGVLTFQHPHGGCAQIDKRKVRRLSRIIKRTKAEVVLTSSNRFEIMQSAESGKQLLDLFAKYDVSIFDVTPESCDGRRDKEIITWLARNDVTNFIILDSESMCCFNDNQLIQTARLEPDLFNEKYWYEGIGLQRKHVRKAIRLLNKRCDE